MNRIFCTGNVNGEITERFSYTQNPNLKKIDEQDVMLILGEFGIPYMANVPPHKQNMDAVHYHADFLNNKPWTTIVLCGSKDNYSTIKQMPQVEKFGTKLRQLKVEDITYNSIYLIDTASKLKIFDADILAIPGTYSYQPIPGVPLHVDKPKSTIVSASMIILGIIQKM